MSTPVDVPEQIVIPPHKTPNDLMIALGLHDVSQQVNRLTNRVTDHRTVTRAHEATAQSRSEKLLADNHQLLTDADVFYKELRHAIKVLSARREQVLDGRYSAQGCERWVKGLEQKQREIFDLADRVYEQRNHIWTARQRLNR